jgi:hypothetical protein
VKASGHAKFQNRYVAFVDILGFSDIVERMSTNGRLFNTIRDALGILDKQSLHFQEYRKQNRKKVKIFQQKGFLSLSSLSDLQMTAFSDSYIISEVAPAWHVLAAVHALASRFLAEGILTRGGIVRGEAYHHRRVVFGPAVIQAYNLESKVAKYPRILVDDSVRKKVWGYHMGNIWNGQLLKRDRDGCWYINLLSPSNSAWKPLSSIPTAENERIHLRAVRKSLVRSWSRAQASRNPSHMSNVWWMIHQFNKRATSQGLKRIERDAK